MERNRNPFSDVIVSEPDEQLSRLLPLLASEKLVSKSCATPATNRVVIMSGPAGRILLHLSLYTILAIWASTLLVTKLLLPPPPLVTKLLPQKPPLLVTKLLPPKPPLLVTKLLPPPLLIVVVVTTTVTRTVLNT
jgi:hypothetical protein